MRAETAAPVPELQMTEAPEPVEKRKAEQGASWASQASESQDSGDDDDRDVHPRRQKKAARDAQLMPPPPPPAKGSGRAGGGSRTKRARGGKGGEAPPGWERRSRGVVTHPIHCNASYRCVSYTDRTAKTNEKMYRFPTVSGREGK
eukprot:3517047-Prymnesium_polylepis.1